MLIRRLLGGLLGAMAVIACVDERRDARAPTSIGQASSPLLDTTPLPPTADPRITITSPTVSTTLTGPVDLNVTNTIPGTQFVAFLFAEHLVWTVRGGEVTEVVGRPPTYSATWDTRLYANEDGLLRAIAVGDGGRIQGMSAPIRVRIANSADEIAITAPSSGEVMSGPRTLLATPSPADRGVAWAIDGMPLDALDDVVFNRGTNILDTTRFEDGVHEITATSHASSSERPRAMARVRVVFNNATALWRIKPRFSEMHLAVGDARTLELSGVACNGSVVPLSATVSFSSTDTTVADVDGMGRVVALHDGYARIHARDPNQHEASIDIVVGRRAFPHFTRGSGVRSTFTPESQFIRSLTALTFSELERDDAVERAAVDSSVSTFEAPLFPAPATLGATPTDITTFQTAFDAYLARVVAIATRTGMGVIFTGDEIVGDKTEAENVLFTTPWGREAVVYAYRRASASGVATYVEMLPDAYEVWGETPTPMDGRWMMGGGMIPNDAFIELRASLASVGMTPVTFPVGGFATPSSAGRWMGDPRISDFGVIHAEGPLEATRFSRGVTLPMLRRHLDDTVRLLRGNLSPERPHVLSLPFHGPTYVKGTSAAADGFGPGVDALGDPGMIWDFATAELYYAVARGFAGVRFASFDTAAARARRATLTVGDHGYTGTNFVDVGPRRMGSLANGFASLAGLEEFALLPRFDAIDVHPALVTGARSDGARRVLFVINFTESRRTVDIDVSPYVMGAPDGMLFRARGVIAQVVRVDGATMLRNVEILPGETLGIVYPAPPLPDAGAPDSGVSDSSTDAAVDAMPVDAGPRDADVITDAARSDADSGSIDRRGPNFSGGGGCQCRVTNAGSAPSSDVAFAVAALAFVAARRRRRVERARR